MESRILNIQTASGCGITAHLYTSAKPHIAGVVIAPALAVPQSFYAPFAEFLARTGYSVWTFDYCGIGESKPAGSMRSCQADVSSWINDDFNEVVKHASTEMAGLPLFVVGHSLGGLITPLLPSLKSVSGIVNIAVGSGAKRHMRPRLQRSTPLLWHVLTPVSSFVFGYFPGTRFGVIGDIPRNALYQWRRWCLNSNYLLDAEPGARTAYACVRCPMQSLFFPDDELISESGAQWLHKAYTSTLVDYQLVKVKGENAERIGHFGFFKPRQEKVLWPLVSKWLEQHSSATN